MFVSVTVLSTRTCDPSSTPSDRAASSSAPLTRSHVAADTDPTVACSADLPGARCPSTRAKRCAVAESRNANASSRQLSPRRCLSTPQRNTDSCVSPWRPTSDTPSRDRSAATQSANSGCSSRNADMRSMSSANGWSTGFGSSMLVCVVRFWRIATSGVSAFQRFH